MTKTNKDKKPVTTVSKVLSIIGTVLIVALIIVAVYVIFCNISGRIAFIGNNAVLRILTPSMEPTIPQGEYIMVRKIAVNEIVPGDVIVFISRDPDIFGKLNTHRVTRIEESENGLLFYTKGDNNAAEDSLPTSEADIYAKYIRNVSLLTIISSFFSNKIVFILSIILPSLAVVLVCVINVIKKSEEVRKDILVQAEVQRLKAEAEEKRKSNGDSEDRK